MNEDSGPPVGTLPLLPGLGTQNEHQRNEDHEISSGFRPEGKIKDNVQIAEFLTLILQLVTSHTFNLVLVLSKIYSIPMSHLLVSMFKHGRLLKVKNFAHSNKFFIFID